MVRQVGESNQQPASEKTSQSSGALRAHKFTDVTKSVQSLAGKVNPQKLYDSKRSFNHTAIQQSADKNINLK